ncbi:hypothetical protein Nmel_010021, partial [Mimus melanotis]
MTIRLKGSTAAWPSTSPPALPMGSTPPPVT